MEGGPQEAERMDELEYEVSLVAGLPGQNLQPPKSVQAHFLQLFPGLAPAAPWWLGLMTFLNSYQPESGRVWVR